MTLKELKEYCNSYRMNKHKGDSENCFHIPYSGMGDPDYVGFWDYVKDDCCTLILEVIDNREVKDLKQLKEKLNNYDDGGEYHNFIEDSLTWQQGLRESDIILRNMDNEEDEGLWEGLQPEEAIRAKAFWTYKQNLMHEIIKLIEEYN